nr:ATP synthase subunit b', chloroplastic [Tanacetum cinerariifolium]
MANMIMASSKTLITSPPTPKSTPTPILPLISKPLKFTPRTLSFTLATTLTTTLAATPLPSLAEEFEKAQLFDFDLTLPIIAAEFLFLMFTLDKLYYSPLGNFMDKRDSEIKEKLSSVKDTSTEVKQLEEQAAAVMRAARAEISAALNQMKKETAAEVDAKLAEGRKKVEAELQEALLNLEKQKEDTIKSLDSQIAALSQEIVNKTAVKNQGHRSKGVIIRGGSSLAKSSDDLSRAGGVPEDPDATTVSSIFITWLAVAVSSGTSWAARGNSGCKLSGISCPEVNSRRYSLEIVDTTSSSCIVSLPNFNSVVPSWMVDMYPPLSFRMVKIERKVKRDDLSRAGGVPEDPDATTVSSIFITWLAVAVSSGTSWAARGRVPAFTLRNIEYPRALPYRSIARDKRTTTKQYPRREIPSSNGVRCGLHLLYADYIGRSYYCEERERSRSAILCETAIAPRARHCPIFQENGHRDPHRKCCYHGGARPVLREESEVTETDLLPIRGRVARRYLSAGRIQAREEEMKKLDQEIKTLGAVEAEVHSLHNQTKNLETLLEAEVDMKKSAETKNAKLAKELEIFHVQFSDLQVSNNQLSQQHCAEMDARLNKLSVDFDEELYPHMLTAIAGRRWVIGHGLTVKGMSEGLKHGIEHGKADRDLATVEAYDPKADSKYVKALQDLKDLKYLLVDQLKRLKDAPMELIMTSLHLESDFGSDGILVYVPTIAPRGLAILLADAATQNEMADKEDEPHPRL